LSCDAKSLQKAVREMNSSDVLKGLFEIQCLVERLFLVGRHYLKFREATAADDSAGDPVHG